MTDVQHLAERQAQNDRSKMRHLGITHETLIKYPGDEWPPFITTECSSLGLGGWLWLPTDQVQVHGDVPPDLGQSHFTFKWGAYLCHGVVLGYE